LPSFLSQLPEQEGEIQEPVQKDGKSNVTLTSEQMKSVVVKDVNQIPIADEFTAVGEVSFDENNVVRVFPIVSGTWRKSRYRGRLCQRGQILATLLSTDISRLPARL